MDAPPPSLVDDVVGRLPLITRVDWVAQTGSTNADLLAEGAAGWVRIADVQTAGRGRRGRTWVAPPGSSLLLSLRLHPSLSPRSWPLLPLVAGTALIAAARAVVGEEGPGAPDLLDVAHGVRHKPHPGGVAAGAGSGAAGVLSLKWPNDLLAGEAKLAGILVESSGPTVVIGIGTNVDWRDVGKPDGMAATSLAEVAGRPIDRWSVLGALLEALDHHIRLVEVDPAGAVQRYVTDCGTIGGQVIAHVDPPVEGTAVGLTPDGHLRIRALDGRVHTVTAGDVEHLR